MKKGYYFYFKTPEEFTHIDDAKESTKDVAEIKEKTRWSSRSEQKTSGTDSTAHPAAVSINFVAKFQHDYTLDILQAELSISVLKSALKKAGSHILYLLKPTFRYSHFIY